MFGREGRVESGPPPVAGLDRIEHIVVLMMENHSFDNYLGTLGHGEGLTRAPDGTWGPANPTVDGEPVHPHHLASTLQHPGNPSQTWRACHIQYGEGRNDGFVRSVEECDPNADRTVPMGFWAREDLPFYAGLAGTFALADHWHCSLLGPTFPNRRYLVAGTSNGLIDDAFEALLDRPRNGTIFEMLDRHGISWTNYHQVSSLRIILRRALGAGGLRSGRILRLLATALVPRLFKLGLDNLQFTADLYPLGLRSCIGHLKSIDRFFDDARAGRLPAFSLVDPDFQVSSEENPQDIHLGEGFAAAVINAVMQGKGWSKTLLVWLYDEHGGYFDHVPPPAAVEPDDVPPHSLLDAGARVRWILRRLGDLSQLQAADSGGGRFDRLGFRVPAVVVSPYAKPGYVSSTLYDHTSVLKLVETRFGLPPLTRRDAAAADMTDLLDLENPAFLDPPTLPPPAVPWNSKTA
jgi:phospholipase C